MRDKTVEQRPMSTLTELGIGWASAVQLVPRREECSTLVVLSARVTITSHQTSRQTLHDPLPRAYEVRLCSALMCTSLRRCCTALAYGRAENQCKLRIMRRCRVVPSNSNILYSYEYSTCRQLGAHRVLRRLLMLMMSRAGVDSSIEATDQFLSFTVHKMHMLLRADSEPCASHRLRCDAMRRRFTKPQMHNRQTHPSYLCRVSTV